jgi:hypothetical protein
MSSRKLAVLALVLSLTWPTFAHAAGEELIGTWKAPNGWLTVNFNKDGSFTGEFPDGGVFVAKWTVGPEKVVKLYEFASEEDDSNCAYTLAEGKLTFASQDSNAPCPLVDDAKSADHHFERVN